MIGFNVVTRMGLRDRLSSIAIASGTTGSTLPGMIDEPGCNAGRRISPSPAIGPEFIQRRSFAIFSSAHAGYT